MDELNRKYLEAQRRLCELRFISTDIKKQRRWIDFGEILNPTGSKPPLKIILPSSISSLELEIDALEQEISSIKETAKARDIKIPLEELCAKYGLTKDERTILVFLFFYEITGESVAGWTLLKLIASSTEELLSKAKYLFPKGTLINAELIAEDSDFRAYRPTIFTKLFKITEKAFWTIAGIEYSEELMEDESGFKRRRNRENSLEKLLLIKEPEISFDQLILPTTTKNQIENSLWQYENGSQVYEKYGLKDKIPYGRAVAMLFYGPPGTGKTATSQAIAKHLGKKIGIANYARIYDCLVGESEKMLLRVFAEAEKSDCILLFDEADSLFAQRFSETYSTDRMYNLMTNLLMQELEKFSGIVILTTNREVVIDKAFERRLLLKLKFEMPTPEMCAKIWHFFLKDCPNLGSDVSFEELGKYPLTGSKIKNAVIKTVMRCEKEGRQITMSELTKSAKEEIESDFCKAKEIGF